MMNVDFFPSRQIALYMARTFLIRSFAVLIALVLVLMILDLLGESGKILAQPGNSDAQLWHYVALRIPQLTTRFLPFSVLLGTLITLVSFNQHSEIISMKAAGISAHQIIAPLMLTSILVAGFAFLFNERIATRATATLNAWEAVDYGPVPPSANAASNVWVRHGGDLIFARQVSGRGRDTSLRDITIYRRTNGILTSTIQAETAKVRGNGWRLEKVKIFNIESMSTQRLPSLMAGAGIDPTQFTLAQVSPDEKNFFELNKLIKQLKAAGRPTETLEAGLWHKVSGPLSSVLMPLLAAIAAFGLARSGQLLLRAIIGMALGFAYFVADNFALAMGNFGAYPPLLAAWGPFILFFLIGETMLVRTEE
jgi:lipopolysaccharide export system permease protein